MGIGQQVDADLLAVVEVVEQLGSHLLGVRYARWLKAPLALAQPQHHHTAIGVGHGAVGGPEVVRQGALPIAAVGQLAFERNGFAQQRQVFERLKIDHGLPLSMRVAHAVASASAGWT
ncbi:hypothetical protein [Thiomonas intermedia]|uniref:hypothetical protein n=1 Tax=Thiomonas intermedia TaxID=926 RepID=UPI0012AC45CE|nr:hypothetical protein [Thiomonas intermedia]